MWWCMGATTPGSLLGLVIIYSVNTGVLRLKPGLILEHAKYMLQPFELLSWPPEVHTVGSWITYIYFEVLNFMIS